MGYLFLLCNVLYVIAFSQTLRRGQKSGPGVLVVGATNYVVAALAAIAIAAWTCWHSGTTGHTPAANVVGLAVVLGALYFTNLLVLLRCYEWAGVGVAIAVSTSGAVPTVLF